MKTKNFFLVLVAMVSLAVLSSCEKDEMKSSSDMTIAEYASSDKNFSILVDALVKADLVSALDGTGNFTVFAPTNAAFSKLFTELGVSGIGDLSKETLKAVLLYHVIGEEKKSSMLSTGYLNTLSMAHNNYMSLKLKTGMGVKINNKANVTTADVDVKNGVIHVIDNVLLPQTVVDHALNNDNFSVLVQAVVKAGLVETLNGNGPFTIFAPTNEAFQKLFAALKVTGISDLSAADLTPILLYHVVSGNIQSENLIAGKVGTLNGDISVALSPVPSINNSSKIIATDVQGLNGVIHVIDEVLLPSKK